ncbi:MAG: dihydrolipoyl dehydrogenase family protein, partial [Elusimicrobiota bacterium]
SLAYKILVEEDTGKILGAHLLGYNSDEVINMFSLAISRDMTVSELLNTTYAFPTFGYDIGYMF